ncbi:glycine betaine/choline ABC-type transport system substrate-binding protein [Arthrobacter sp. UYP6]|uniref:glycine betaine ABC transporter substrate-binding protein n=1 Tax=Arthrobacter sp. UYP6 TaxID=1756378 RepID=UPI0033941738
MNSSKIITGKRKRKSARKITAAAGAAVVVGLTLGGCGLQPAASYTPNVNPGSIQRIESLPEDAKLTIVSKNFTEQLILGKIAVMTAQAAGFEFTDLANVPGSQPVRELMLSGQADVAWEYTGSAWISYLGMESAIPDQAEQWQAVYDADLANGLTWGQPAPMNNTYAMAVRTEAVAELGGITRLSELAALPVEQRTFCLEAEFNSRPDGFNPMTEAYGMARGTDTGVPEDNIGIYDTGAVYTATDEGACNFGEVFTTDGRIDSLDLTVLEDDRNFFPAYNGAPVFNTATLAQYPELEAVFAQVSPLLTDEVLRQLNLRVDVVGEDPADVAYDWMLAEGLVTEQ